MQGKRITWEDVPLWGWTPERDALLGTSSDRKVALKMGCGESAVQQRRTKLGIDTHRKQKRDARKEPSRKRPAFRPSRYQQELALPNTLTHEQWEYALEWFGNQCAYCGETRFLEMEHLVPVSKEGPKTVLNIIPACWRCNYSKRAQRADKWIYQKFGMEQGKVIVDRIVAYLTEVKSLLVP